MLAQSDPIKQHPVYVWIALVFCYKISFVKSAIFLKNHFIIEQEDPSDDMLVTSTMLVLARLNVNDRIYVHVTMQVSISPTFYEQLFHTKVFWAAFLYLGLRFVFFFGKRKLAQTLLVKCWWNWLQDGPKGKSYLKATKNNRETQLTGRKIA